MKTISFQGHHWQMEDSGRGGDYAILKRRPTMTEIRKHRGVITRLEIKIGDLKEYQPRT